MQVRNRWFVNEDNRTLVLKREYGYRQAIMIRVTNHMAVPVTPIIAIGNVWTTATDTLSVGELQPECHQVITVPAKDANDVLFKELFVFVDYDEGDENVSEEPIGIEVSLSQNEVYSLLDFFGDRISNALPT